MYSSTFSLTSALDVVVWSTAAPAAIPPGKRHGTHCIGGWVGPQGRSGWLRKILHIRSLYRPASATLYIYRVSQEERAKLREGVPYVKLYRYNPKHLYPKLNGYGDNGK